MENRQLSERLLRMGQNTTNWTASPEILSRGIEDFLDEYSFRNTILAFEGVYSERFADGVPSRSDAHKILHKIVGIGKTEGNTELFICDTQEDCRCYGNYCGKDESYITLNLFDKKTNPETLLRVRKDFEAQNSHRFRDSLPSIGTVANGLGLVNAWREIDMEWLYHGIISIEAMKKGGVGHHKYLESSKFDVRFSCGGTLIVKANPSYQQSKQLIERIRQTYK